MKIITRIIETILGIVILFTGFVFFSVDDCSCGQCFDDDKQIAKIIMLTAIVLELVILLIKSRKGKKENLCRGISDFIVSILIILETFLVIGLIFGTVFRIGDDSFAGIMEFSLPLVAIIAFIALFIFIFLKISRYEEPKESESEVANDENTKEGN